MREQSETTKILFVDSDEAGFEIRQCIARVLAELPPVELFHANDASEGLQLLDRLRPDVVILDNDLADEITLFIDSLSSDHPPILVCADPGETMLHKTLGDDITRIPRNESLEGLHQMLVIAATLASKAAGTGPANFFH